MEMPKVSVIITTYNRGRFVCAAIESVLAQNFRDAEIIVVDDGSRDDTYKLLKRYGSSIYYIYQKNKGRSVARNNGIRLSRGEYAAFLDDDDIWLPGKLESQVAFLDSHPACALAHTFTELMDERGQPLKKETKKHLRLYRRALRSGYVYEAMSRVCLMFTSSVVMRRHCLSKVGLFDPSMETFEDWDIYLRLALKYEIGVIPEPLVRIRIHAAHSTQDEFTRGRISVSLKHLGILDSLDDPASRARARYNFYLHLANAYYIAMDTEKIRGYILRALSLNLPVLPRLNLGFNLWAVLLFPGLVRKIRGIKAASGLAKRQDYPQRIKPLETFGGPLASHLKRYEFAARFCKGMVVLDAASGVGYGSGYLADIAKEVIGLDISAEAITYAKEHYQKENTRFEVMDVCSLNFPDRYFDLVCSFETLEHLNEPLKFLAQIKRVLKEDGILIISTPNVKRTVSNPDNPYHKMEFSRKDFNNILRKHFSRVEIFGQRRRQSLIHYWILKVDVFHLRGLLSGALRRKVCHGLASSSWDEAGLDDFIISKEMIHRAAELIGVCRQ